MVATFKKNAKKSEKVAYTVSETVEVAKMIPQLNRKVINALGMTPRKFLTSMPEEKWEDFFEMLYREYPGLHMEREGEFYGLPFWALRMEMAVTLLQWIGSESRYWEDVKVSKTKPFFHLEKLVFRP